VTRTVVKANYVPLGGGRSAVRSSAGYYGHRPDEDGERHWRPGFDAEKEGLNKEEVYGLIGEAEGEYAYRIVLSPGREMEADEVRRWTREVMESVERRGGEWVAFVHDDHTAHPHAHVIAFTDSKLGREDFAQMREEGDRSAEPVLEFRAEVTQDPMGTEGWGSYEGRASEERKRVSEVEV
jgi:relaxase-like protein